MRAACCGQERSGYDVGVEGRGTMGRRRSNGRSRGDGFGGVAAESSRWRGDGSSTRTTVPSAQRGFTLIEVLLATVLLAGGLALAMTTLRAAAATVTRGEAIAQRSERMRAVSSFLRHRIGAALPMGFETDPETGVQSRFVGSADRMRFVADLPDYLGQGGPHLHDIALIDAAGTGDNEGPALAVSFAMVQGGVTIEEREPRPPEPLVEGVEQLRFRYRGLNEEGRLGEWQQAWETVDRLPLQVAIAIDSSDGDPWPELVIALPQAGAYGGTGVGERQQ